MSPLFLLAGMSLSAASEHLISSFGMSSQPRAGWSESVKAERHPMFPVGSPTPLWFHGMVSRLEAERALSGSDNGTFLVRESTNYPGDYTLSVAFNGKVEHYRVQQRGSLLTCDDEEFFCSLPELVEHYRADADGLCHRLLCAVGDSAVQRQAQPADEDSPNALSSSSAALARAASPSPSSDWTIARQQLNLTERLGRGEFGDVHLADWRGRRVAVKLLACAGAADALLAEAATMAALRHPNLVRFLGVVRDSSGVALVTEYMPNGSLLEFLRSRGRQMLSARQQVAFAVDVCSGMAYLEAREVVHRDLAARNVLLSADQTAKVSDFGLARPEALADGPDSSSKFPIKWTAPEALRHGRFSSKADVWSFGVLLWEIYSFGRVPYPRIPVQDVLQCLQQGYRMDAPADCPVLVQQLMSQAWALEAVHRPTFHQMLCTLQQLKDNTS